MLYLARLRNLSVSPLLFKGSLFLQCLVWPATGITKLYNDLSREWREICLCSRSTTCKDPYCAVLLTKDSFPLF